LTLGASTAVFSIVNGVLLQPLAYRESQRLVSIREVVRETSARYPQM
jgi:putative ABC transport system permease protein